MVLRQYPDGRWYDDGTPAAPGQPGADSPYSAYRFAPGYEQPLEPPAPPGQPSASSPYAAYDQVPEGGPTEDQQARLNKLHWGSETVTFSRQDGKDVFSSSLTGMTYPTARDAVLDENLFRTDNYAWTMMWREHDRARAGSSAGAVAAGDAAAGAAAAALGMGGRTPPTPSTTLPDRQKPSRPVLADELSTLTAETRPTAQRPTPSAPGVTVDPTGLNPQFAPPPGGTPQAPTDPATGAPQMSREHIDKILDPLDQYASEIAFLGRDNTGLSLAEAQLNKAHELARQRNADLTRANQAGAMGMARGARNRGDRALLERQAIGEQAYLGSEAQRQQANADNQLGLDLAILRAQEEDYDNEFRLEALKTAAELGLNTAALEVDIEKVNVAERGQALNRDLQLLLQNNQITNDQYLALLASDDRKMQALLEYSQAMSAIEFEYEKLSVDDQNFADQLLMQKYGIDKQTMVALKQIKEQGKFQWDQVLASFAGGVGSGFTGGLAGLIGGKKQPAAGAAA